MKTPFYCFHPDNARRSEQHAKIYAIYEIIYTIVDFSAAALFLVGSYLFFYKSTTDPAIWMFIVGSGLFGFKPTLRLIREVHFWRMGNKAELAKRAEDAF
ncbi:YrhK family protein [Cochlodiniinecator piscidefendens]|uniref:YrhK family protein n=1 Tax=Cochlodiniinecator piscidefendens TaxID=2715756 RepID=UPI00140E0B60